MAVLLDQIVIDKSSSDLDHSPIRLFYLAQRS